MVHLFNYIQFCMKIIYIAYVNIYNTDDNVFICTITSVHYNVKIPFILIASRFKLKRSRIFGKRQEIVKKYIMQLLSSSVIYLIYFNQNTFFKSNPQDLMRFNKIYFIFS
jgi:hypothetical protein